MRILQLTVLLLLCAAFASGFFWKKADVEDDEGTEEDEEIPKDAHPLPPKRMPTPEGTSIPVHDNARERRADGFGKAPADEVVLPGLKYEFWNNVTLDQFDSEAYLWVKDEREPQEGEPLYRPPVPTRDPTARPGMVRNPPEVVMTLPQVNWVLFPQNKNDIFPNVFPDHFVAVISGK